MDNRATRNLDLITDDSSIKDTLALILRLTDAFIADNGLELPEEALKLVSGGCGSAQEVCLQCGSTNIVHETSMGSDLKVYCRNCGCILFMQPLR